MTAINQLFFNVHVSSTMWLPPAVCKDQKSAYISARGRAFWLVSYFLLPISEVLGLNFGPYTCFPD
jgi:hypothetical protein